MRQHGVGRAPDPGELELDAGFAAAFGDRLVDLARPVAAAELGAHIIVARHALGRHVGIELEGPPGHGHVGAAAQRQGALEAPLADVAPRTDRVGDDVDVNHAPSLRLSRQCRKRPAAAAIPSAVEVSQAAADQPPADDQRGGDRRAEQAAEVGALHQQAGRGADQLGPRRMDGNAP